jgi:probable rRNA maturation factor
MEHELIFDGEVEVSEQLQAAVDRAIRGALDAEKVAVPCEINVLFTNDESIHQINLDMRGVDQATDVLSFPMFPLEPGVPPEGEEYLDPESGRCPLGDMCISMERVEEQAAEYGHSLEREVCYLAVHSILHLLGYDHMDEGPMKAQMRAREEEILDALGITRA